MHSAAPPTMRRSDEVALFGAVLAPPPTRTGLLRLLPFALALHLLALAGALRLGGGPAAAARGEAPEALVVHLLAAATPAQRLATAVPEPPSVSRDARPRAARLASRTPEARRPASEAARPAPREAAPPWPALEVERAAPGPSAVSAPSSSLGLPAGLAARGRGEGSAAGAPGGSGSGSGSGLSRLTPEQEEQSLEDYLEVLYRRRFRHVRYPHQAAAAGITGLVSLRVVVGRYGELRAMERVGRCPHPVLCEGAEEAVRGASPFPPPPPELGTPLAFELPFRFFLH